MGKYVKKLTVGDIFFIFSAILVVMLLLSPVIIKISFVRDLLLFVLPKSESILSAYYQIIGTLVGTLFAVSGALWTQNKFNEMNSHQEVVKSSKVIYFDLVRGFEFARDIYLTCLFNRNTRGNEENLSWHVILSNDWIMNVSSISNDISFKEQKCLYDFYEELFSLNSCIEKMRLHDNQYRQTSNNYPAYFPSQYNMSFSNDSETKDLSYEKYRDNVYKISVRIIKSFFSDKFNKTIENEYDKELFYKEKFESAREALSSFNSMGEAEKIKLSIESNREKSDYEDEQEKARDQYIKAIDGFGAYLKDLLKKDFTINECLNEDFKKLVNKIVKMGQINNSL